MDNRTAKQLVEKAVKDRIIKTIELNKHRHIHITTLKGKNYYILRKDKVLFKPKEGMKTPGDSINVEWLAYCLDWKNKIDLICFVYPSRKIYTITPIEMVEKGVKSTTNSKETTISVELKHLKRLNPEVEQNIEQRNKMVESEVMWT